MKPAVSVVINCRNGEPFLEAALQSVFGQTFGDFEVVFWDNLSSDNSPEIARAFGTRLRYYRSESPLTLGEARRQAVARAIGEFIAILDVDDRWRPAKLDRQVSLLETNRDLGLVYCDSVRLTATGQHLSRWSDERRLYRGRVLSQLLQNCFISMSTVAMRRSVLDQVGSFDPRFSLVEEWDLFLRIAERHGVDYVDDVLVEEQIHSQNFSRDYDRVTHETSMLMSDWMIRAPAHQNLCRRMIAMAQFRREGVRAYRQFMKRNVLAGLANVANCGAVALRHPVTVATTLVSYGNAANRSVFRARFS